MFWRTSRGSKGSGPLVLHIGVLAAGDAGGANSAQAPGGDVKRVGKS